MRKVYTYRLTAEEKADLQAKAASVKMQAGAFIRWLISKFKIKKEG